MQQSQKLTTWWYELHIYVKYKLAIILQSNDHHKTNYTQKRMTKNHFSRRKNFLVVNHMRDRESDLSGKKILLLSFNYMNHKFFKSEDGISSYIPSTTFSPFAF